MRRLGVLRRTLLHPGWHQRTLWRRRDTASVLGRIYNLEKGGDQRLGRADARLLPHATTTFYFFFPALDRHPGFLSDCIPLLLEHRHRCRNGQAPGPVRARQGRIRAEDLDVRNDGAAQHLLCAFRFARLAPAAHTHSHTHARAQTCARQHIYACPSPPHTHTLAHTLSLSLTLSLTHHGGVGR